MRAPFLHGSLRAVTGTVAAVLASALLCVAGAGAPPAGAAPAAAKSALTLQSQSPAFISSQSGVSLGVDIDSALPASRLSIEVTLYSVIVDRYNFRQTLSGSLPSLLTPLGNPGVIPLDLKSLHWTPGSELTLRLPVTAPDLPGNPHTGTGGVTLSIFDCAPPTCGGVYPLQVSLLENGVGPVASFTTFLIVTPPSEVDRPGTHPLHFAWVLPLGASTAISAAGVGQPDTGDLNELEAIDSALEDAPNAAVSLDIFPQFIESLENRPDLASEAALEALRTVAGQAAQADILPGTFVPVDPDAVVASGLSSALNEQLARARQILQPAFGYDAHDYAVNGPLNAAALALLTQSGITRLILPSSSVQPLSATYSQWTPTAPFLIPGSAVEAMASDPGLDEDLASTAPAALKAQDMLADLSIQYFDNTGAQQAVALESPVGVPLNATFLQAILTGLSGSSIVHAQTLTEAFDTVPPDSSNTSPPKRQLRNVAPAPAALLPATTINAALASVAALGSVLPDSTHPRGKVPLSDLVLMAEGSGESLSERYGYLDPLIRQAASLAGLVSLPFGRTITVTSLQAKVPISIVSNSRTPFMAVLRAACPGLGFPKGDTWHVMIYPRTNIVPILLTARTTGDFSLQLTLATTSGFTIQSGSMTIRSTAISGVAVALSIGAAAFLVVWWLRSILTKRRKKHKLRGAALAAGVIPGSSSGA